MCSDLGFVRWHCKSSRFPDPKECGLGLVEARFEWPRLSLPIFCAFLWKIKHNALRHHNPILVAAAVQAGALRAPTCTSVTTAKTVAEICISRQRADFAPSARGDGDSLLRWRTTPLSRNLLFGGWASRPTSLCATSKHLQNTNSLKKELGGTPNPLREECFVVALHLGGAEDSFGVKPIMGAATPLPPRITATLFLKAFCFQINSHPNNYLKAKRFFLLFFFVLTLLRHPYL